MSLTLTVADVYGTPTPQIPDGYEAGDLIHCASNPRALVLPLGKHMQHAARSARIYVPGDVRLELRKKPALVRYEFTCEEGKTPIVFISTGEVREPHTGEYYKQAMGVGCRTDGNMQYFGQWEILVPVTAKRSEV